MGSKVEEEKLNRNEIKVSSRDVTIYRQTLLRGDGKTWLGYINLSDMDFSDGYGFPTRHQEDWAFPEFTDKTKWKADIDGRIPETEILIEVQNPRGKGCLYFPMTTEKLQSIATARIVNEQWKTYDLQEIIIAKDFFNKNNLYLYMNLETKEVESTISRRNDTRMAHMIKALNAFSVDDGSKQFDETVEKTTEEPVKDMDTEDEREYDGD